MEEQELLTYLSKNRYRGTINIPRHSISLDNPKKYEQLNELGNSISFVKQDEKDVMKKGMLEKFYSSAPFPKVTRLLNSYPKYSYLDQELDVLLNSGLSQIYRSVDDGNKMIGGTLSMYWKTDWSYEASFVSGRDWFNAAAKVAHQYGKDDGEVIAIYRDFVYQWIYHTCQYLAQKNKKNFILYNASGYVDSDDEGVKFTTVLTNIHLMQKLAHDLDGLYVALATRKNFLKRTEEIFPLGYEIVDIIEYGALDLTLKNKTENLFESNRKNGSMIFARSKY